MEPLTIYISGPYTADSEKERLKNIERAINAAIVVMQKGHYPFVPHLFHWIDKKATKKRIEFNYEKWMEHCLKWLDKCEAILYLAPSPGANIELAYAVEKGMPVFYSPEEVPSLIEALEIEIKKMLEEPIAKEIPDAIKPEKLICDCHNEPLKYGKLFVVDLNEKGDPVYICAEKYWEWIERRYSIESI